MRKVDEYIAYLITKHDCVVIPGLGAFVSNYTLSSFDNENNLFTPAKKWLSFNPEINHQEGLLANFIAQTEDISYEKALSCVHDWLSEKVFSLQSGNFIEIQWVGKLIKNENNSYDFLPQEENSLYVDQFGRAPFFIEPLKNKADKLKKEAKKQKNIVIHLEISKQKAIRLASTAAAIIVFLFISAPLVEQESAGTNYAAIIPSQLLIHELTSQQDTSILELEIGEGSQTVIESNTPVEENEFIHETISDDFEYKYAIIVASLRTKAGAEKQLAQMINKGYNNLEIMPSANNSIYRICIKKCATKEDGLSSIQQLNQQHPELSDIWLMAI